MGLDFTALNNIPLQVAKKDFTEPLGYEAGNLALKPEKPATGQNRSPSGEIIHSHKLDAERQERARLREMYSTYQENIRRAGSCRSDILKGMKRGEDPLALLLKAIECISLMTGDTVILEQGKADILAIYGWGLGEVAPLQTQLEEARTRLDRLTGQEPREGLPPAEYSNAEQRIQGAIREHRELIASLERAIARAKHEEGHSDPQPVGEVVAGIVEELRERQGAQHE